MRAVQTLEEPSLYWRDLLAQAGAKHREVLYESLLGASRAQAFQSAVTYIGGPPHARLREAHKETASGSKQNLTLRVHPITCEERIQDWSKLKLLLKSDSLTLTTCELLASLARNQSQLPTTRRTQPIAECVERGEVSREREGCSLKS